MVVVNSTTITATTPAGRRSGDGDGDQHGGQSGSLTNGFTYVAPPTVSSVSPNSGIDGGRNGSDDHGNELCDGSDGDVRERGGDERSGSERDDDHGDNAGGECRSGDGDRNGERAERKPDQRVHLCSCADGEQV